ncbi:esterase family protein [Segetibacter aerophilus]|nr:alpha/beta hydrolase-fold protein [Segetibacter aerophilus]
MNREYHKWLSPHLKRNMELLVFGHAGTPVLFFPTRTARFYDYENWKVIDAIADKINKGWLQVYCVDSIDLESFYCSCSHPSQRIVRHIQYEKYIVNEVLPLIKHKNSNNYIISTGCSLGAYHAVNISFRQPQLFGKVVGMSGRYDLTLHANNFSDLFDGYQDENVYFNMPSQFIPNLTDQNIIRDLKKLQIVLAVGKEDPFLPNNQYLHNALLKKGIANTLHIWEGEAHRPRFWQQMVQYFL